MALKLMYITNRPEVAAICEGAGVDRVFIDLETVGKEKRQHNLDTVKSHHSADDIGKVKAVLSKTELLVRANPIYDKSEDELDMLARSEADIIMLPFFSAANEVYRFLQAVNGRKRTCLLFETPASVENAEDILSLGGIDEVYIGLNDLHLGYKKRFMFELLTDGTVEALCNIFKRHGLPYGFGGVAAPTGGTLKGEYIIGEHYRLGSTAVILSRSFCNAEKLGSLSEIDATMQSGVKQIRECEKRFAEADEKAFAKNSALLKKAVEQICASIV